VYFLFASCVGAYFSDWTLLETALRPHRHLPGRDDIRILSLDHSYDFFSPPNTEFSALFHLGKLKESNTQFDVNLRLCCFLLLFHVVLHSSMLCVDLYSLCFMSYCKLLAKDDLSTFYGLKNWFDLLATW
jgi:hypothetical protein